MHKALTQGFSRFLRRRRALRHVERRPLLDALVVPRPPAAAACQAMLAAVHDAPAQALARLQPQADGLGTAKAARRPARDGTRSTWMKRVYVRRHGWQ